MGARWLRQENFVREEMVGLFSISQTVDFLDNERD